VGSSLSDQQSAQVEGWRGERKCPSVKGSRSREGLQAFQRSGLRLLRELRQGLAPSASRPSGSSRRGGSPSRPRGFGSELGRQGDLTEGRFSTVSGFGSSGGRSIGCSRGNSRPTLHRSSLFRAASLGESREILPREGVSSQAREAELEPEGGRQRSPPGGLAGVLRPTLESGKAADLRTEIGEAGQGLRGNSKVRSRSKGWRSCLEESAVLRPGCPALGEGPKWLTVIWRSGESRKCLSRYKR
jgi:hypothetical protein